MSSPPRGTSSVRVVISHAYIHADTHAYIHADTHAYIHADTHAYIHADTHAYIHADTHAHIHAAHCGPSPRGASASLYIDGMVVVFGGYGPSLSHQVKDDRSLNDLFVLRLTPQMQVFPQQMET